MKPREKAKGTEATALIVNGRVFTHAVGGIARYARQLVQALARSDGLEWKVAIPPEALGLVDFIPPANRLVLPVPLPRGYILPDLIWNHHLSAWIRRHCPRALLHNTFYFWAPFPPQRTILTAHDCFDARRPRAMASERLRLHRQIAERSVRRALRVIAVSDWTRREVMETTGLPPERVVTIYNWLAPSWETPPTADEIARVRGHYHLPPRYAAYVGGFREYKNVGMLLRAWALGRRNPDWPPLVLAGRLPKAGREGTLPSVEAAIATAGLTAGEVRCPGAIDEADLPAFYAGAALFISASRQEGFGYPAVEAMACGAPVVVADASAFRETVPEAYQRFDPTSPASIFERASAALARPADFRRKLDPRFTERHGFNRYLGLIRELAGSAAPVAARSEGMLAEAVPEGGGKCP